MVSNVNVAIVHLQPHTVSLITEARRLGVDEATFGRNLSRAAANAMRNHTISGTIPAQTSESATGTPVDMSPVAAAQINNAVKAGVAVDTVIQQVLGREIPRAMMRHQ